VDRNIVADDDRRIDGNRPALFQHGTTYQRRICSLGCSFFVPKAAAANALRPNSASTPRAQAHSAPPVTVIWSTLRQWFPSPGDPLQQGCPSFVQHHRLVASFEQRLPIMILKRLDRAN